MRGVEREKWKAKRGENIIGLGRRGVENRGEERRGSREEDR